MELIFNPCGEFRWSFEGLVSQFHSCHFQVGAPGIFWDLLRSVQMLKREWSAESNRKLLHLLFPSKSAILVPKFGVEDVPLDRTATCICSERPALGQNTYICIYINKNISVTVECLVVSLSSNLAVRLGFPVGWGVLISILGQGVFPLSVFVLYCHCLWRSLITDFRYACPCVSV